MTRVEIIKKAFDYLVFKGDVTTRADFADAISYNRTNLSSAMNGNEKYLSDSLMGKIAQAFPVFDKNWLLTGEGTMLKVPAATMTPYPADEMVSQATPTEAMREGVNVITDAESVDLSELPVKVVEEIKAEVAEEIKREESIIIVSPEVASTPGTNIKKYIKDKGDELERMYLGDLLPAGVNIAERVRKTSMFPSFQPGDWIFVKFINKDNITDGDTYYFDFNTRPTMIRKVKLEGDDLRLIAKNSQFGDIIIKRDEINNIGDIVGMFREYCGDQYDDIENLRRKKDAETAELIKQNGDALKIVERLVSVIEKKQ